MSKLDIGRHVASLCTPLWKRLGKEPIIRRILLKQQLSSQPEDVTIRTLVWKEMPNPIMWSEVKERCLFGPDMIKEAKEQVAKVR